MVTGSIFSDASFCSNRVAIKKLLKSLKDSNFGTLLKILLILSKVISLAENVCRCRTLDPRSWRKFMKNSMAESSSKKSIEMEKNLRCRFMISSNLLIHGISLFSGFGKFRVNFFSVVDDELMIWFQLKFRVLKFFICRVNFFFLIFFFLTFCKLKMSLSMISHLNIRKFQVKHHRKDGQYLVFPF